MSPKVKAKELVDKYYSIFAIKTLLTAKQCALICVNQIIASNPNDAYWQEVKQEIEKQ